ncbi:protein FAM83H isoform X2 [Melanotaenia boesemani]|nr:protein FAM83H isoform X2 [Melanotaenia boesemani]XP_041865954.1 protein FAM83H isoform X2 [Melanotaenia boesemani]
MARRSQCSSAGDNPLDPNYLPPHYREEYRLAIDALVEEDLEGYYQFLQKADVVDFLSTSEIQYIQSSVQVPRQSNEPEQPFLETGADGSSGTYWPLHSDLDVPGLDLGWPQLNPFLGPTEVTTLINPPEPDMPSIKEQARRLIKNAQQVIAIVMDMFTDVDMFADILNAAMRNVAVYILLDEQNAHHFINMASNCRVDLQSIQSLCVRTVSGSTYQCRSGKSFKGQVMDRFLLTDCRAVLSGNYSFMWSFEKLHRCMAHLFLGQLVTTFDEEFRILFAQSQPLVTENALAPMEDLSILYKRQYPNTRTSLYREPKKWTSPLDISHSDEWARHSSDERMDADWRVMALKRQESLRGPAEMYGKYAPQQSRLDPCFDPGLSRIAMMDNPAYKRHSYAEGVQGRYSLPFLQQQGMPDFEPQGKPFQRGQGTDYSGYDKFWNQDYYSADQYSEPGLTQDVQPPDNFDPVFNYLSSTRKLDFDQSSEKLQPAADLPFSSSYPTRLNVAQPYVCQTSPPPSSSADQKQFFLDPTTDRKDPMVKRGLRDWRISSFLSAYEAPAEEGLPLAPPQAPDPQAPNPIQQTAPAIDFVVPKIPNVREFKVPAIPRASQMPSYAKTTTLEQPKKSQDEPPTVASETKTTQRPCETFSKTEGEKMEEAEPKEPKTSVLRRDDSFKRNYSAAVQRSSRLRSSLIFSSLDQSQTSQETTSTDQSDEQSEKNETELTKLPFVSRALGQRRSAAREPFEWSQSIKSSTFDNSSMETSKADDKESSKEEHSEDISENPEAQEPLKLPDMKPDNISPSAAQSKPSEAELPKTDQPVQPPKPLLTSAFYVDMNDPDQRLMFFKELAAKRRAAKATEDEKRKEKAPMKPPPDLKSNSTSQKEKPAPNETSESFASVSEGLLVKNAAAQSPTEMTSTEARESAALSLDTNDIADKDSVATGDSKTPQSCSAQEAKDPADSEMIESDNESVARLPVSAERKLSWSKSPNDTALSVSPVTESINPPTPTNATPTNVSSVAQDIDERESPGLSSTSEASISVCSRSVEVPPSFVLDIYPQNPTSVQLEPSIYTSPVPSGPDDGSGLSSNLVEQSWSQHSLQHSGTQIIPSTTAEVSFSNTISGDSGSTHSPSKFSLNIDNIEAQDSVSTLLQESPLSAEETSQKSDDDLSNLTGLDFVPQLQICETPPEADATHLESKIFPDTNGAGPEPKASLSQSTTETSCEEFSATYSVEASEKNVSESEKDGSGLPAVEECDTLGPSKDIMADSTSPKLNLAPPESGLLISGPESSISEASLQEAITVITTPAETPPKPLDSETSSNVSSDVTPNTSLSGTTPQDTPIQATPPHHLNLTDSDAPAATVSITPLTESEKSLLSPEIEKTETDMCAAVSVSDQTFISSQTEQESDESLVYPSTQSPSIPTDSASKAPAELDLPCKTLTCESQASETPVPTGSSIIEPELVVTGEKKSDNLEDINKSNKVSTEESVSCEKINDQVKPSNCSEHTEIPFKQPKSSQSRYHSSTANVLSSSNLRDDTKLLLEQISANCQNRSEAAKESPVTDDEKEDEADKNAKKEQQRGFRTLSRGPPKSTQDREKLLERIQSMRKERKVYSRFEMAP